MKTLPTSISLLLIANYALAEDSVDQPKDIRGNAEKPFAYTGEDFTRLPTRVGFSYDSIVNHENKSNTDNYLVTGSLSLMGLQVLAEVPVYARSNPGNGGTQSGFGDTFVSGAFSLPLNPKTRLAIGLDTMLNTSSQDELGKDENLYSPFLGVGLQLDEESMFLGKFSYTTSSDDRYENIELLVRGLHRWSAKLFTSIDAIPGWDIEDDNVLLNARALAGAHIDRHNVASLELQVPFDHTSRKQLGTSLRLNYNYLF